MNNLSCLVRIVDDEADVRDSLSYLFTQEGWRVRTYESAEAFLSQDTHSVPGCIVLDVQMNGISGLELQDRLIQRGISLPIVFFTGHGTLEGAVRSMKKGASDFLTKTVTSSELLSAVAAALQEGQTFFGSDSALVAAFNTLTEQEKKIAELVSKGLLNGDIAQRLQVSSKTIRNQKVLIKQKLHVDSTAALTALVLKVKEIRSE